MTNEVEFVRCLGHGVKLHVLEARWGANTVVLKTTKQLGHPRASSHLDHPDKFTRKITKQEFIREVSDQSSVDVTGCTVMVFCLCVVCRPIKQCF